MRSEAEVKEDLQAARETKVFLRNKKSSYGERYEIQSANVIELELELQELQEAQNPEIVVGMWGYYRGEEPKRIDRVGELSALICDSYRPYQVSGCWWENFEPLKLPILPHPIDHDGGEYKGHPNDGVRVKLRNGSYQIANHACSLRWINDPFGRSQGDIISYQLITKGSDGD